MASMPETNAATMPDEQRPDARPSTPASPRDELAHLEERGAGGDRGRHQEAEAGGRLAVEPGEPARRDARCPTG